MAWFAVCYQETGEEGIIHPEPGETREQVLERIPEEWRFRYFDEDYQTKQEKRRAELMAAHGEDDDFDVGEYMEYLDERQSEYDDMWG